MLDDLRHRLTDASDIAAACRAVAAGLVAARGDLMPSVYLERGGRLRCMAVLGYWQVRDGMTPTDGVIGRTFSAGSEMLVQGVEGSPHYLAAGDDVVAELCVPLLVERRSAGVLNVEAPRLLADDDIALIRDAASALAARIEALGGPPLESPAQRLARHAVRMAEMESLDQIEREVLAAALDVADLDSAMLLDVLPDGHAEPRAALGPLAPVLLASPQEALRAIAAFVATGASSYTVAAAGDGMATGMAALRGAGAESLAAFGAPAGDRLVVLVLADGRHVQLVSDRVEVLELLATHAASCLRSAVAVRELRERAATDPLTGLGHHATFHAALAAGRTRDALAVALCDVDGFKRFNDTHGHQAGDRALRTIAGALSAAARRADSVFRVGGDEFAALVHVADAAEALEAGHRLRAAVADSGAAVTISIGVALAAPGEPDGAVLDRADRALYAVKAVGRDGVALAEDGPTAQQALPF